MGIREAAHGLQTTKNPNPKRFFSDLGIHDPKGRSRKEHLDTNHPSLRDHATPQIPPIASVSENRPLKNQKTGFLEIVFKRNMLQSAHS